MLERLSDWLYDPLVFWGAPFVLLAAWAAMKWIHGRMRRKGRRR